jgi:G-patch domain
MKLYAVEDPDYAATPLHFPIPPPFSVDSLAHRRRSVPPPAPRAPLASSSAQPALASSSAPFAAGAFTRSDGETRAVEGTPGSAGQWTTHAGFEREGAPEGVLPGCECTLELTEEDAVPVKVEGELGAKGVTGESTREVGDRSAEGDDAGEYIQYSAQAQRMMSQQMGWRKGQGLGAQQSGRTAPLAAAVQRGRRGLGFESHPAAAGKGGFPLASSSAGLGWSDVLAEDVREGSGTLGPFSYQRHSVDAQRRVECSQMVGSVCVCVCVPCVLFLWCLSVSCSFSTAILFSFFFRHRPFFSVSSFCFLSSFLLSLHRTSMIFRICSM